MKSRLSAKERGKVLRQFRKSVNLSMKEVGDSCGLSESMISLFETGKKDLSEHAFERVQKAIVNALKDREALAKRKAQFEKREEKKVEKLAGNLVPQLRKEVDLQKEILASYKKTEAISEEISAYQDEIIKELKTELARLELLNKELSESKDREIKSLREQLEAKKRLVTIPPDEYDGLE